MPIIGSLMVGKCPICPKNLLHTHPIPYPVMASLLQEQENITPEEMEIMFGNPEAREEPEEPRIVVVYSVPMLATFALLAILVIEVWRLLNGR